MNLLMQILYISLYICGTHGLKRYWIKNSNVLNKDNWERDNKNCKGLVFPRITDGSMLLDNMTINQIVFPEDGLIYMNNVATIRFDKEDKKCIKIKPQGNRHILDPRNWNALSNKAIPDTYRIPCIFDDVYIPENSSFNINLEVTLLIRSVQFGSKGSFPRSGKAFIRSSRCQETQDMDCPCRNFMNNLSHDKLCSYVLTYKKDATGCEDPLFIHECFCTSICGAQITFISKQVPKKVLEYLEQNSGYVDYYFTSTNGAKDQRNLFIVDKYTDDGYYSSGIAKEVYNILKTENIYKTVLQTSGKPLRTMEVIQLTFEIILGALFLTIIFFVVIFVVYVGVPQKYGYKIRWPSTSKYTFRPFTFARFENRGEGGLSFERSVASSVVSLEKSFQNPLYGTEPSTSKDYLEVNGDTTEVLEETEMNNIDSPPLLLIEDVDEDD